MAIHSIQAVSLNAGTLAGVVGVMMERGWQDVAAGSDGTNQETLQAEAKSSPGCEFRSVQVGSWLTALASSVETPCLTLTAAIMYGGKAAASLVGYAGGSVHKAWTASAGMAWVTGIAWSDGGHAEITVRAAFVGANGSTDPIVPSLAALPTLPVPAEAWTVTSLSVGGVAVPLLKSLTLSIDPKVQTRGDAGLPYPIAVYGGGPNGQIEFRLEFETEDILAVGDSLVTGAVVIVLTQYAQGGVLSASTKTITLANCLVRDVSGPITGSQGQAISRRWLARPRYNGTTYPMVVS